MSAPASSGVAFQSRLRRAAAYLRPYRSPIGAIAAIAVGLAGLSAAEPLLLKYLFDRLIQPEGFSALGWGIAALGGLILLRECGSGLSNWLSWRTRIGVQYRLLEAAVGRLHQLPVGFHRAEGVGAVMTKLDRGIQGLVGGLSELAFHTVPAVVYLIIAAAVMVRLEWRLALLVIAFAPAPALIAGLAAPLQTGRERALLERWMKIYSRFNEVLSGIVTVKSFAMEDAERQRFLSQVGQANRLVIRGVGLDSGVAAAQSLAAGVARVAALVFGGSLVAGGEITLGTLIAFLGYIGGLFAPVQGLAGIYRSFRLMSVSLEQIFSILDAEDGLGDAPGADPLPALTGRVAFRSVRFSYPAGPLLLDGVDVEIQPGMTVALVGPSGAGKTTLMSLLLRLYDPTEGRVEVDGRDLRQVQQMSLRRQIGVVLQDALLFNESVRENIAYGWPAASAKEIEAAARAAHAHEFIIRLPEGYDTRVGDRGNRLSAGERQRIAIARALLKDPPILILDEPTSALDAESEFLVQQALSRLTRGRTTFAIAHRLSTVVNADRILVLKDGKIVEQGNHFTLMGAAGYYASLVERQLRGLDQRAA